MHVPIGSLRPKLLFQNLEKFLIELEGVESPIAGGIAVYGPAAAYALVPEYGWDKDRYGNILRTKRGPKTVWSTNPKGERALMSKQAPHGYISIHEDEMWPIFIEELSKVNWAARTPTELRLRLEIAVDNADQRIAKLVSDSAPVDSGDLRSGIDIIDSGSGKIDISDVARSESGTIGYF